MYLSSSYISVTRSARTSPPLSPPCSKRPTPVVTHPGHNALNQQTGAEWQTAGAIEDKELSHFLQACAKDPLRGTGEGTGGRVR